MRGKRAFVPRGSGIDAVDLERMSGIVNFGRPYPASHGRWATPRTPARENPH
jgi:hypothetical protein